MTDRSIAIGLLGCGSWGSNLLRNFASLPDCRVKTIVEPDPERRAQIAAQHSGIQCLAEAQAVWSDQEIRAVVIASPSVTHYQLARAALLAGKDVYVEKPMALHQHEGEDLVHWADTQARILMVGHILQYHPAVRKLKEMVESGALGQLQYVYSHRLNIGKIRTEENILWSFAPHDISVILMLLGEMPATVHAHAGNYLHHHVPDVTMTTLTFASGVRGHIFVSWLHPFKEQKLVLVGDKRMAVFNDAHPRDKLLTYAHQVEWIDRRPVAKKAEPEIVSLPADEPLRLECNHFLDCVRTRLPPRTDGPEGLRVLSVLEACQASLDQQGAPISLTPAPVKPGRDYFVHESSYVDDPCVIGEGTKIWHFSHVLKGSQIGRNCTLGQNVVIGPNVLIGNAVKIQNNVSVYTGVTLEDDVFCGPSMAFTNVINPRSGVPRMDELKPTLVKRGATLGANCTVICGHTIGAYAFVGAGSVVTKDVPDYALVVGNPGRVIGWMCRCGVRLQLDGNRAACTACEAKYELENGHSLRAAD